MTNKELQKILSKYPEDTNIYISVELFHDLMMPIEKVKEGSTMDENEPLVLILHD